MATLLVIEDELVLAKNIARFFEKAGHLVEVAHDGAVGLHAAERIHFDGIGIRLDFFQYDLAHLAFVTRNSDGVAEFFQQFELII